MSKFKITVQIFKEFILDAVDEQHAKEQVETTLKKIHITDKYNINEPKNLDKKKNGN